MARRRPCGLREFAIDNVHKALHEGRSWIHEAGAAVLHDQEPAAAGHSTLHESAVRGGNKILHFFGYDQHVRNWRHLPPVLKDLLPRMYFLESLLKKMDDLKTLKFTDHHHRSEHIVDADCDEDRPKWSTFYEELKKAMKDIQKTISFQDKSSIILDLKQVASPRPISHAVPISLPSPRRPTIVKRVIDVIDKGITEFIQKDPELSELFRDDVPGSGQGWENIMEAKLRSKTIEVPELGMEQEKDEHWKEFLTDIVLKTLSLVDQIIGELDRINISLSHEGGVGIGGEPMCSTIFFATDRLYTVDGSYSENVLRKLGPPRLHYGWMEVSVPRCLRRGGKLEEPSVGEDPDRIKHELISSHTNIFDDRERFFQTVNKHIVDAKSDGKENSTDVLIFIHGYNSPLKKNVRRLAKLKRDLDFHGTVIFYSWSAGNQKLGYLRDEGSVHKTITLLQKFIQEVRAKVAETSTKVHLMAHSMGNRALIAGLQGHITDLINKKENLLSLRPLSQVVFVAADESVTKFIQLIDKLQKFKKYCSEKFQDGTQATPLLFPTLTTYSNREDIALTVSRFIHFDDIVIARLGDTRSCRLSIEDKTLDLMKADFVDVVDATGVGISTFQHSYYCETEAVLNDLKAVLQCRRAKERAEETSIARTIHAYPLRTSLGFDETSLGTIYAFNEDELKRSRTDLELHRLSANLNFIKA